MAVEDLCLRGVDSGSEWSRSIREDEEKEAECRESTFGRVSL